jgi:hypothetical protein
MNILYLFSPTAGNGVLLIQRRIPVQTQVPLPGRNQVATAGRVGRSKRDDRLDVRSV